MSPNPAVLTWPRLVAAGSYADVVLADSPLGYWRLGESSGTTMNDSSGAARHGTYAGTWTLGVTGAVPGDTAVSAAGAGHAEVAHGAWMDQSAYTVEAIAKTTATTIQQIVHRDSGVTGARGFQFRFDANGTVRAIVWNSANGLTQFATPAAYNNGAWHHVALTVDGTTARIYVDGTQRASVAQSGGKSLTYALYLARQQNGTESFVGDLDEVAYYGSALSAARILAHAQAAGLA